MSSSLSIADEFSTTVDPDPHAAWETTQAQAAKRVENFNAAVKSGKPSRIRKAALDLQSDPIAVQKLNQAERPDLVEAHNKVTEQIKSGARENIKKNMAKEWNKAHPNEPPITSKDVRVYEPTNYKDPMAKPKSGQDWDATVQVRRKGSKDFLDVPPAQSQKVVEKSYYDAAGGEKTFGKRPPGVTPEQAAAAAAHRQAVETTHGKSPEAYNQPETILGTKTKKPKPGERLSDPEQLTHAIENKSNQSRNKAAQATAGGNSTEAVRQEFEQMRQASKQYDKITKPRVEAAGGSVHPHVEEGMKILRDAGEGKISPEQARAKLAEMGETPENMISKASGQAEAAQKLKPSGKSSETIEPSGKAPAGEPSGPAAGKTSPESVAKGPKSPPEPAPTGKASPVEPSGQKTGRTSSEPIVEPAGKGGKTSHEPTAKGGPTPTEPSGKTTTAETPREAAGAAGKPTPDQAAKGGKPPVEPTPAGKTSAPEPASAGKAATPEPTGTKGRQPTSERIAEPSIKDGPPSAKTAAEPTGKPAGQIPDTPKGKGPVIDAPDAPKGRAADVPDAKPRAPGAPDAPKMGALRKGVNIAGEVMNVAGTFSDAEDFKEAAKKGDTEGMLKTGVRGVAGLTPLGSAAVGAKDTYDMVKERRTDKAEAENAIAEANKRHEETYDLQSALKLRQAGMSRDDVKQIMAAKARGDEGPLASKFKELGLTPPERAREEGPKADDTAWERTKEVAGGMATQAQKAGKFLNDARKDLTEIGTGLLDKGTRDEVAKQVKENVSLENIKDGLEAREINKKADADRAAARDKLEDKLVEKGASRDEARNAADAWDQGDRAALDRLKEKMGLSGAKTGKPKPEGEETAQSGKNGGRLTDLRESETRTDQTDKEKRKDSPTDPRDGTKLAQNTNTADSYSKDRTSKSSEDAQQARGDAGSTLTERIAGDQARNEREKGKIESQGQETNRAIAGAQREHAGAERGQQADRQNSIGNVIAEGAAGGLTSGVAAGIDKFGSTVGAAAGDKASSQMGIKPKAGASSSSASGDPGSASGGGSPSREQTSSQTPAGGSAAGETQPATASAGASAASGTGASSSTSGGPKPASSSGSQRPPTSSTGQPTGIPCKNQKPGGPDWVCVKQIVCYSDKHQTVTDCAEWANKTTGARTKPTTTSSPATTAAATPPRSSTGTQALWDCICRCNSSASSSVSVSYDLKPRNSSPSCAKPENGQCVNQGFGCWRHKFDSSSACAKSCYKSHNVAESARP